MLIDILHQLQKNANKVLYNMSNQGSGASKWVLVTIAF